MARGIAPPWTAPEVGEAVIAREQPDAEEGGDGERAEMRDEQPLEPKAAGKEQSREDQSQNLFPDDAQEDLGPEHHARAHRRGRDLDEGPERQRPDEKLDCQDRTSVGGGKNG